MKPVMCWLYNFILAVALAKSNLENKERKVYQRYIYSVSRSKMWCFCFFKDNVSQHVFAAWPSSEAQPTSVYIDCIKFGRGLVLFSWEGSSSHLEGFPVWDTSALGRLCKIWLEFMFIYCMLNVALWLLIATSWHFFQWWLKIHFFFSKDSQEKSLNVFVCFILGLLEKV